MCEPNEIAGQESIANTGIRLLRKLSIRGELPVPSTSREQTGDVIGRFDKDSPATDLASRFRENQTQLASMLIKLCTLTASD